jgi:hypothetical protein
MMFKKRMLNQHQPKMRQYTHALRAIDGFPVKTALYLISTGDLAMYEQEKMAV